MNAVNVQAEGAADPGIEAVAPTGAIDAIYAIGHALLEQQRAHEAVKIFRVMLRLVPSDERSWLGLASCHEDMDEVAVAAELYGAGYAVSQPPSARCLSALARLARTSGDLSLANECDAELVTLADGDLQ
jgi:Tfp pilus assembly protein PilF